MKERMKLEKAKKNGDKGQQKRKNQKDDAGQKKKKKSDNQAQNDKENDLKAKEKEEKKKEEEQRRQTFLQEARKAQAAQRWPSTSESDSDVTIVSPQRAHFTPVPLHRGSGSSTLLPPPQDVPSTSSAPSDHQTNQLSATPLTTEQDTTPSLLQHTTPVLHTTPAQRTTPAQHTTPAQRTPAQRTTPAQHKTPAQRTTPAQRATPAQSTTPAQHTNTTPAGRKQVAPPRRGIHFQSAVDDSSDDEVSEEDEDGCVADESSSSGSCCKEQKMENEALRKRLDKVHRRLNIACKSCCCSIKIFG